MPYQVVKTETPQAGSQEQPFDVEPEETGFPTSIDMKRSIHWSGGFVLTHKNKSHTWAALYNPIFEDCWNPSVSDITVEQAAKAASHFGIDESLDSDLDTLVSVTHEHDPHRDEMDVETCGRWFWVDLSSWPERTGFDKFTDKTTRKNKFWQADLQSAYHGTSLLSASLILKDGFFRQGPNITEGRTGIYCEGPQRKPNVFNYMTHAHVAVPGVHPLFMWAAVLELYVDRNYGGTIHRQWTQPQDSLCVEGMFIHVFSLADAYKKGYTGWFRVHAPSLRPLGTVKSKDFSDVRPSWAVQWDEARPLDEEVFDEDKD